jgi:hypothetical protein
MASFAAGVQGTQGAAAAGNAYYALQQQARDQAAQAQLAQMIKAYAAQQGGAPSAPTIPGGAIQPGGVSPLGGAAPSPAGGMPGGAGPSAPMGGMPSPSAAPQARPQQPPMSSAPGGLDISRIVNSLPQGGSGNMVSRAMAGGQDGINGAALEQMLRILQPQANNATRVEIGNARNQTSEDNTVKRVTAEERGQDKRADSAAGHDKTSSTNAMMRATAEAKKMTGDELSKQFTSLGNVLAHMAPDNPQYNEITAKYAAVGAELNERRQKQGLSAKDVSIPGAAAGTSDNATPPAYSQEDLEYTAKQNNMTVDEVKKKLGVN